MFRPLASFADIHYGRSPANVLAEEGEVPVFGTGGIYERASASLFPGPAVIIPRKGTLSHPHLAEGPFWPSDTTYAAVPKRGVNARWLYYQLCQFNLEALNEATGVPSISRDWLAKSALCSQDTDSQTTIARVLSAVDTQIEATEALIVKQERVRAGLMQDLFTRGVDEHGQLRPPREEAPDLYHRTELGWLPKGWGVDLITKCVNSASDATIGPFGSNLIATDYRDAGVPVIFVRDVKADRFVWKSDVFVDESKAKALSAHSSRSSDVVATKMGFPPCIACVHPDDFPPAIITADMIRLRVSRLDVAIPEFVSASLNNESAQAQVRAITGGVTRPKITLADFRAMKLAYPLIEEQILIVEALKLIDKNVDDLFDEVEKLHLQKTGLMQDLLTNKVSVAPLLEDAAA